MKEHIPVRVVVDTNVVFEGLTQKGGASGLIIDAWLAGLFKPFVSNALAYEYMDVLSDRLSAIRWQKIEPVLGKLLEQAMFVTIYYTWRPSSPDPADEHIIDCAMNSAATIVTSNIRDFQEAKRALGLRVITPVEFVIQLTL